MEMPHTHPHIHSYTHNCSLSHIHEHKYKHTHRHTRNLSILYIGSKSTKIKLDSVRLYPVKSCAALKVC